jgi:hypothetical protein
VVEVGIYLPPGETGFRIDGETGLTVYTFRRGEESKEERVVRASVRYHDEVN